MRALLLSVAVVAGVLPAAMAGAQAPAPPTQQAPPTITGDAKLGGTLTIQPGTWDGTAPISFTYTWMRCHPDCAKIPGATGQSYTVTDADAQTTSGGVATVLTAYVTAANAYGGVGTLIIPGTAIDAPRAAPRTQAIALTDALAIPGLAGEIPQLLKHGGYTAQYYVRHPGIVTITWTTDLGGQTSPLAVGHATFRHATSRRSPIRVRLTKRGRRLLGHAKHIRLFASAHIGPLDGSPGNGAGVALALSRDAAARIVSV